MDNILMDKTTMKIDCKSFQSELPDLVLTANARPSVAAVAHMRECPPCAEEYLSFQSTFAALDVWKAPEPSAYFDQKLAVRIRGGIVGINGVPGFQAPQVTQPSAAVNDLQILDRNEQAFQQLDELQQEDVAAPQDTNGGNQNDAPAPDAPPST
jgi:hypothetical protein